MGGNDGCRNDILLIVMDYKNTGGKCQWDFGPTEDSCQGDFGPPNWFQVYGTTIRSSISSPSISNNNLALLGYGSMCVRTLVHIARYQSKTSNNNNRFQLLILVTLAMHVMISDMYSRLTVI